MRLARKLTIVLIAGIVIVMACYAYFQLRQEVALTSADLQRAQRIALAWLGTIEAVWEHEGPQRALELTARAMQRAGDIALHILPLDAGSPAGSERFSTDERRTLAGGQAVRRVIDDDAGDSFRHIYVPLMVSGTQPMVVEYVEPMEAEDRFIRMSHVALISATAAVVAACGLIASALQYALVGRPLKLLRDKARRAGTGDFSQPLNLAQNDEVGELARDINAMCEHIAETNRKLADKNQARIAALEQLRHTDRLATVGQLAAGVAHELGTPLSVVSARAQVIVAGNPDAATNARVVVEQCERMTDIIQQLLDFSRRRGARMGPIDLRHVVTRTLDLLSSAAQTAHVEICYEPCATALPVNVDQNQMQQAFTNIVLNGIQAMPAGGRLTVRTGLRRARPPAGVDGQEGDYPCVSVEDGGTGIHADQLERIFEPFFTTKGVGEGTGLGLAVAHGIVAEHGGWITVDSEVGVGTRFAVFLPPAGSVAASGTAAGGTAAKTGAA